MADIWKEVYKPKRKGSPAANPGSTHMIYEFPPPPALPTSLSPKEVWYVRVCSFTFAFHSMAQLEACFAYYSRKIHSTSRITEDNPLQEPQRWFERLPMYLLEEPKRKKVVAALQLALNRWTLET